MMTIVASKKSIVWVNYIQPDFSGLNRQFPTHVNPYCKGREFVPIESCKAVSRVARDLAFEVVCMDDGSSSEEGLAEMKRLGLRPALFEEFLCYEQKHSEENRVDPLVALGSVIDPLERRRVAVAQDSQSLYLGWFDEGWLAFVEFLAVRE